MTDLIACLSENENGKNHIQRLIKEGEWDNIFLVATKESSVDFDCEKRVNYVIIDSKSSASEIINQIQSQLKGKLNDLEVGLNIVCGSGKEHMALLSALLKLGVGVRLMAVTKNGVAEI